MDLKQTFNDLIRYNYNEFQKIVKDINNFAGVFNTYEDMRTKSYQPVGYYAIVLETSFQGIYYKDISGLWIKIQSGNGGTSQPNNSIQFSGSYSVLFEQKANKTYSKTLDSIQETENNGNIVLWGYDQEYNPDINSEGIIYSKTASIQLPPNIQIKLDYSGTFKKNNLCYIINQQFKDVLQQTGKVFLQNEFQFIHEDYSGDKYYIYNFETKDFELLPSFMSFSTGWSIQNLSNVFKNNFISLIEFEINNKIIDENTIIYLQQNLKNIYSKIAQKYNEQLQEINVRTNEISIAVKEYTDFKTSKSLQLIGGINYNSSTKRIYICGNDIENRIQTPNINKPAIIAKKNNSIQNIYNFNVSIDNMPIDIVSFYIQVSFSRINEYTVDPAYVDFGKDQSNKASEQFVYLITKNEDKFCYWNGTSFVETPNGSIDDNIIFFCESSVTNNIFKILTLFGEIYDINPYANTAQILLENGNIQLVTVAVNPQNPSKVNYAKMIIDGQTGKIILDQENTIISGDQVFGGVLKPTNTTQQQFNSINLNDGTFKFGNAINKILFDGNSINIDTKSSSISNQFMNTTTMLDGLLYFNNPGSGLDRYQSEIRFNSKTSGTYNKLSRFRINENGSFALLHGGVSACTKNDSYYISISDIYSINGQTKVYNLLPLDQYNESTTIINPHPDSQNQQLQLQMTLYQKQSDKLKPISVYTGEGQATINESEKEVIYQKIIFPSNGLVSSLAAAYHSDNYKFVITKYDDPAGKNKFIKYGYKIIEQTSNQIIYNENFLWLSKDISFEDSEIIIYKVEYKGTDSTEPFIINSYPDITQGTYLFSLSDQTGENTIFGVKRDGTVFAKGLQTQPGGTTIIPENIQYLQPIAGSSAKQLQDNPNYQDGLISTPKLGLRSYKEADKTSTYACNIGSETYPFDSVYGKNFYATENIFIKKDNQFLDLNNLYLSKNQTTDIIQEGTTNLFFTESRVKGLIELIDNQSTDNLLSLSIDKTNGIKFTFQSGIKFKKNDTDFVIFKNGLINIENTQGIEIEYDKTNNKIVFSHKTEDGFKHIPAGQLSGQFIAFDGTNNYWKTLSTNDLSDWTIYSNKIHNQNTDSTITNVEQQIIKTTGTGNIAEFKTNDLIKSFIDKDGVYHGKQTCLQNVRTIQLSGDGVQSVEFDGSQNVTGTLVLNTVPVNKGGTGRTTISKGAILYQSANNVLNELSVGNNTYVLTSDGVLPKWQPQYSHPVGDGNLHVPQTGTTNIGKFLMQGNIAGAMSWASLPIQSTTILGTVKIGANISVDETGTISTHNPYVHPTGDGNLHIPQNGTTNAYKFLMQGSTQGTVSWSQLPTQTTTTYGIIKIGSDQSDAQQGNHTHLNSIEIGGPYLLSQNQKNLTDLNIILSGAVSVQKTNFDSNGSITLSTTYNQTVPANKGGTGFNSYGLGEIIYQQSQTTLQKLSANTTTTKKFLTQTGTGTQQQQPQWNVLEATDIPIEENIEVTSNSKLNVKKEISLKKISLSNEQEDKLIIGITQIISNTQSDVQIKNQSWLGKTIQTGYGGTGLTSFAVGDLLYASATNVLSKLQITQSGNVLKSGTTPQWGKITNSEIDSYTIAWEKLSKRGQSKIIGTNQSGVPTDITTIPIQNGGTGKSSFNNNQILYGGFQQSQNLTFDGSNLTVAEVSSQTINASRINIGSDSYIVNNGSELEIWL